MFKDRATHPSNTPHKEPQPSRREEKTHSSPETASSPHCEAHCAESRCHFVDFWHRHWSQAEAAIITHIHSLLWLFLKSTAQKQCLCRELKLRLIIFTLAWFVLLLLYWYLVYAFLYWFLCYYCFEWTSGGLHGGSSQRTKLKIKNNDKGATAAHNLLPKLNHNVLVVCRNQKFRIITSLNAVSMNCYWQFKAICLMSSYHSVSPFRTSVSIWLDIVVRTNHLKRKPADTTQGWRNYWMLFECTDI